MAPRHPQRQLLGHGDGFLQRHPFSVRWAAERQGGLPIARANTSSNVKKWDAARAFALALPAAEEDAPWGEAVIKVRTKPGVPAWRKLGEGVAGPMFLWLGQRDSQAHAVFVKLTVSHDAAIVIAHATPTTVSGLGQWGWVTVPLARVDTGLLCEWIEESYRAVAPKRLIGALDAHRD